MLGSLKRYGQLLTAKTQVSPPYKPEWLPGIKMSFWLCVNTSQ